MSKASFTIVSMQQHPPPTPPHSPTGLEWNCTPRKLSAGRGRQLPLSRLETEGGGGGAAAGPATRHHASPPSPRTAARCDSPLGASLAPIPPPPTRNTCLFPASGEAAASLAQVSKTEGASEFGEAPPPPLKRAGLDGGLLGRGGGVKSQNNKTGICLVNQRNGFIRSFLRLHGVTPGMKLKWPRPFAPTNPQWRVVGRRGREDNLSIGCEKLWKGYLAQTIMRR